MIDSTASHFWLGEPSIPNLCPTPTTPLPNHRLNHADSVTTTPAGDKVARKNPEHNCPGLFISNSIMHMARQSPVLTVQRPQARLEGG